MKHRKNILNEVMLLFLIVILSSFVVLAAPSVPHQFYGDVSVNGDVAPDNLFVEARIDGSVFTTLTNDGKYGFDSIFYVEDPNSDRDGEDITFFVGNPGEMIEADSFTFSNGEVTSLDLSVSGLDVSESDDGAEEGNGDNAGDNSAGASGGVSSGAGSGFSDTSDDASDDEDDSDADSTAVFDDSDFDESNSANSCESDWACSEWTECINFQQRRVCVDSNNCGVEDGPEIRRSCEMDEAKVNVAPGDEMSLGNSFFSGVTGFVTGAAGVISSSVPLIILLVLVTGVFLFLFFKKKKN